jgi:hypothetical protein
VNIEITAPLQRLIDRVYPGMTHRQQAGQIRELLHDVLLDQIPVPARENPAPATAEHDEESCTKAANRVASMSPAIDDQNWAKLESNIHIAQQAGLWDNPAELRLIGRLNDPFDGAENEHRVQNSRITAFFRRLLAC